MKLQRYHLGLNDGLMRPRDDGAFVYFSEVQSLLSRYDKLVEACKRLEEDDDMQAAYDAMVVVLRDIEGEEK